MDGGACPVRSSVVDILCGVACVISGKDVRSHKGDSSNKDAQLSLNCRDSMVSHVYNRTYLGGRDLEDCGLRPTPAKCL